MANIVEVIHSQFTKDIIVKMDDGSYYFIDHKSTSGGQVNFLSTLDAEDGTVDGHVDFTNFIDGPCGDADGIAQFVSGSGQDFTLTYGKNGGGAAGSDFIIHRADGTVIVTDQVLLTQLDSDDGNNNNNGIIDVDLLDDSSSTDGTATFYSSDGNGFTVERVEGEDSYLIQFDNGNVVQVHGRRLDLPDGYDGDSDGRIDVDNIAGSTNVDAYTSSSGQGFTVTGVQPYGMVIELNNGNVIYTNNTPSLLDAEDGNNDGFIDIDNLVDSSSADKIVEFYSGTNQDFNFKIGGPNATGGDDNVYLIEMPDGSTVAVDSATFTVQDDLDGLTDGRIDIDALANQPDTSTFAKFVSSSEQNFTVENVIYTGGDNGPSFVIRLENGDVIITRNSALGRLDTEDGTRDGPIDVDNLVDDRSSDNITLFQSGTDRPFTITAGPNHGDLIITFTDDGTTIVTHGRALISLDEENQVGGGRDDGVVDVDLLIDGASGDNIVTFGPMVCFTAGTMIKTDKGEVLIEALKAGDKVKTLDNGYREIRWIGKREIPSAELHANPNLKPVTFTKDSIAPGVPSRDLQVSPQHRFFVKSKIAQRVFGESEVLIPATKLVQLEGIYQTDSYASVEYFHILFDQHEIIEANAALAESLYLGKNSVNALSKNSAEEISAIFPDLDEEAIEPARSLVFKGSTIKTFIERHHKNDKSLVQ